VIYPNLKPKVNELSKLDESKGKLKSQKEEEKLMHSVLDNDRELIDKGKLVSSAINHGISFVPDLMYENLVNDYALAEKLYGETIIRLLTGYDPSFVKKNVRVPEFKRELLKIIAERVESLKQEGLIGADKSVSDKGIELASLILYFEELDNITAKGDFGEKVTKKHFVYGERDASFNYKKSGYKDIDVRKSAKLAIRRNHKELTKDDLKVFDRKSRGKINVIYALDASGSMKGKKIEFCKKAGVALAYKVIDARDKVGLIVFGSDVKEQIEPCEDFMKILKSITGVQADKQTDIAGTINNAIKLFKEKDVTRHLILLTDAMPTVGDNPTEETLEAASCAKSEGITISVIGINLDDDGKELAHKIVEIGEGRMYAIKNLENIDKIVLEDYYSVM
jgi:Mg-chelatase subunit ChlD